MPTPHIPWERPGGMSSVWRPWDEDDNDVTGKVGSSPKPKRRKQSKDDSRSELDPFIFFVILNSNSNSLTLKKPNSNSLTLKKLNSNSLTLKKLNSNSLTLEKSNSNSNSSITRKRIQIQIQSNPTFHIKDLKRILQFAPSQSQSRSRRCALAEVESSKTSLASGTHFEVLRLGLEGQVLGLGLEASSPRKLPCPWLEDSTVFLRVEILLENARNLVENLQTRFLFSSIGA